jgi:hypothetical protein
VTARSPAPSRLHGLARQAGPEAAGTAPREERQERCDLCAEPLPPDHRHLLDLTADTLACACRACSILFDRAGAGGGQHRLVPTGRRRLDGFTLDDTAWTALGVPVGLAHFTRSGETGTVTAGHPGPAGTTRAPVDPATWEALTGGPAGPVDLADDVEALLVARTHGLREHWIVPVDDCYRLVAVIGAHWKGLGGGPEVWEHVARFFAGLGPGPATD